MIEDELNEVRDGAWGNNPAARGAARDKLAALKPPADACEWIWFGEDAERKHHVSFGRWPVHASQHRYKYAVPQPTEHDHPPLSEGRLNRVADAIEAAQCPRRHGPYGLFDYTTYPGIRPAHVVRDLRDRDSDSYDKIVGRFDNADEAHALWHKLTRQHIAAAAVVAVLTDAEGVGDGNAV